MKLRFFERSCRRASGAGPRGDGTLRATAIFSAVILAAVLASGLETAEGLEAGAIVRPEEEQALIPVQGFRFAGNSVFPEATLAEAVAGFTGRVLTFAELEEAAERIAGFYRARGYFLAQAYIPAQVIEADGIVTIAVEEGRYGAVVFRNGANLREDAARALLGEVRPGAPIQAGPLERALLLLEEIPGVRARGALAAGKEPGTSDLTVYLEDEARFGGALRVDSHGHELTGRVRATAHVDVNNPGGYGDRLLVQATTSGAGLGHGSAGYEMPLWGTAWRLSVGYSASRYEMGGALSELGVDGKTEAWRVAARYPVLRALPRAGAAGGRLHRLDVEAAFETRKLEDRVAGLSGMHEVQAVEVAAQGSGLFGAGALEFRLAVRWGRLHIVDEWERFLDSLTARMEGEFVKVQAEARHERAMGKSMTLEGAMRVQWASKNLHISEKLALGGAHAVRAYDPGEASGDAGVLAQVELEGRLYRDAWRWAVFADGGAVRVNQSPWEEGENARALFGGGVGLIYAPSERFDLRVEYAVPVGAEQPAAGRHWARATYRW